MMHKFSVFIPAYNAGGWIDGCLKSIFAQNYPKEKIEVILVDGDSEDNTKEIASRYPVKILDNPKRLAHYAFNIYGRNASGDLTVMFAADNELSGKKWFSAANSCFEKRPELAAVWGRIISGQEDSPVNKYIALIQNEPLSYFINKNTEYYMRNGERFFVEGREARTFQVMPERPLVWGANGLVLKRDIVNKHFLADDFIGDNDIFQRMIEEGHDKVAYVPSLKTVHHHANSVAEWSGKLRRNYMRHFLEHRQSRNMNWAFGKGSSARIFLWALYAGIPVFSGAHAVFLAAKDRNKYWLYHPLLNFIQFFTYAGLTIFTKEGRGLLSNMAVRKRG